MRTLIGGIGYRDLRDHSIGVMVTDRLAPATWPAHIAVEDVSYNPIAVIQRLEDERPAHPFERVVLIGATQRPGRAAGTFSVFRWDRALPDDAVVQAAVAEAVTGVISLDNTLMITEYFRALPPEVIVVDVEPDVHEFGDTLSPRLAMQFDRICTLVTDIALDALDAGQLPDASLGGGARVRAVSR